MSITPPKPRLVRHYSEYGCWDLALSAPADRLRGYVCEYQGYAEQTPHVIRRREVPSGMIPLIINFGPPFRLLDSENPDIGETHSSFVAGLHDTFALVESNGRANCMQVNLTPLGARRLLGVPMCELANSVVDLDDFPALGVRSLIDKLYEAPDWDARFTLLDAFFIDRLTADHDVPSNVAHAWHRLASTGGQVRIAVLAEELGWSRKHLVAQFHEHVGLPPKRIGRILRFQHAIELLSDDSDLSWVDVALRSGYYDQAHLIMDFRQFAGCTPGDFDKRFLGMEGGMIDAYLGEPG